MPDFDQLFAHRGGFDTAYVKLCVYAVDRIRARSGTAGGGAVVASLDAKSVVNKALVRVITENTRWDKGEEVYLQVRRHIDNHLRTIQKSPVYAREQSLETPPPDPADELILDVADENASNPADEAVKQEENEFNKAVLEATKAKYPPNSKEAKFIDQIIEGWRDRQDMCELLDITPEQYDALLKRVSRAATAKKNEMLAKRKQ